MSLKAELDASKNHAFTRKALVSVAVAVLISETPFALAQDQTSKCGGPTGNTASDGQRFAIESDLAVSKMSLGMTAERTGDVDRDFVAMMRPHHQGAIDIARAELKYGRNEALRRLARDIIVEQEHEMLVMRGAVGEPISAQTTDRTETTSEHATSGHSEE